MEIKFNAVGFSASSLLEDFIQKKISKLDKYHDGIIGAEVTLKLEKDDNLENKVVEVLLNVKGQEVFAKKNAKKFEEAVDAHVPVQVFYRLTHVGDGVQHKAVACFQSKRGSGKEVHKSFK